MLTDLLPQRTLTVGSPLYDIAMEVKLKRALAALGDTLADVVGTLRRRGIKGRAGNTTDCPIANYLKAELGVKTRVIVNDHSVNVGEDIVTQTPGVFMRLPEPVRSFVMRFDGGMFQDLNCEPRAFRMPPPAIVGDYSHQEFQHVTFV